MKNIVLCILLLLAPLPVFAADADALAGEIVYRASLGRADDIALLLKQGASANQTNEDGAPVLALAAARRDKEGLAAVETLLEAGAGVNAIDRKGQTALFYAARQGNVSIVSALLERNIDYYATDHDGNIARTIAHNAGHKDIVKLLDDFVSEQTKKVGEQYKEYNETIRKQYEAIAEEEKKRAELAAAAAQNQPQDTAAPEEIAAERPEEKRQTPEFDRAMHDLAFHNCAFQYWSFCRQARQTTDLTADELNVAIDSHKEQVLALTQEAMKNYGLDIKETGRVSTHAKQRIVDRLAAMPSNTYRFERGVCKMADMKPRCDDIANSWEQAPEPVAVKKPSSYKPARRRPR